MAIGALPPARNARAGAPPYGWYLAGDCSLLAFATDDNCGGCDQGTTVCCCHPTEGFVYGGYEHKGPDEFCQFAYRPDQCKDKTDPNYGYDGWYWQTDACCYISSLGAYRRNAKWSCADGWYMPGCDPYTDIRASLCKTRVLNGNVVC